MKSRCLIVDDEPPARQLLESYLKRLDDFDVVNQFGNAVDAFSFLQNHDVDLMFLDIQMPHMTGLELLKSLRHPPRVVLTTAFREYALEGFELDVLDYLVKPISFERFMKAIGKYHHYIHRPVIQESVPAAFEGAYMFVKVNKDQVKVYLRDILYVESIKDYLKIVTKDRSYLTYHRLSSMEDKLPGDHFVRIHKSYIVSMSKIHSCRNDLVRIGGAELPIGRVYKKIFLDAFQKMTQR